MAVNVAGNRVQDSAAGVRNTIAIAIAIGDSVVVTVVVNGCWIRSVRDHRTFPVETAACLIVAMMRR